MTAVIVKFPYSSSRRVHSQKPRRSKNGTPEERAAALAANASPPADVVSLRGGDQSDSAPDSAPDVAPYSGLPVVPPQPGDDRVFHEIERHRAAAAYNQAVETHCAAEGKVSEEEYEALQAASSAAYQGMMLFGNAWQS